MRSIRHDVLLGYDGLLKQFLKVVYDSTAHVHLYLEIQIFSGAGKVDVAKAKHFALNISTLL